MIAPPVKRSFSGYARVSLIYGDKGYEKEYVSVNDTESLIYVEKYGDKVQLSFVGNRRFRNRPNASFEISKNTLLSLVNDLAGQGAANEKR
jgi:hypothetical protein